MLPISITTCFDYSISIENQIKMLADINMKYLSLGMDSRHSGIFEDLRLEKLKQWISKYSICIDTIHCEANLDDDNWYEILEKTMKVAVYLETNVVVMHATQFMFDDNEFQDKLYLLQTRLKDLVNLCKEYRVKVALENVMPGKPTDLLELLLEECKSDWVGFCYDASHDQIDGPRDMALLRRWKHRLFTTHLSDRIKPFEDHVIPGEGFINMKELIKVLQEAEISFPLLFEVEITHSKYKNVDDFLQSFYQEAISLARGVSGEIG